jgi:CBS domain-containing protein
MRGGTPFEFRIKGLDELILKHDSVMVEACNCSFQVHFQVGADEFAHLYNVAQAVAGPVLAVSTNSPLLFGRRLWRETRVATFQQSLDTRSTTMHMRELSPRVSFGRRWVDDSVLELFKEDVARFRVLLGGEVDECSLRTAREGGVPALRALRMHNGTIYRWNRACYGITDGVPHLRIENRLFPSGPTVIDEIANAAFWFGLIGALSDQHDDVRRVMDFDDAASNFQAAARLGLNAQFEWLEGRTYPAQDLLRQELLPLAREGLVSRHIDPSDADRFLGVVEERIESRQTGSQWMLSSLARMREGGTEGERLNALTAAALGHQRSGRPVARWPLARLEDAGGWEHNFLRVEQYMTTDMFTVHEEEPIDLVANLMDWERIRHVPVEDEEHRLVGLVSYRSLLRYLARARAQGDGRSVSVRDIMTKNPVTVGPDTRTLDAIAIMRERRLGCLPVIKDGRLVGVVVERDFMGIASELLSDKLGERD